MEVKTVEEIQKAFSTVAVGILFLIITGCSSFVSFNERAVSIDDVIFLSKANVDSEIIIRHLDTTHSRFRLETEDIIRLKNGGVDDDVIEYMIESDYSPEHYGPEYGYSPYDYWYDYYNSYYYPYSGDYYNPIYRSYYGEEPYYYNTQPYIVRRERGLVGRFHRYYPLVPPNGRYDYLRDRYFDRREREREESTDESEE